MSAPLSGAAAGEEQALEAALQALTHLSGDLLASHRELERRAARVEAELLRTNRELEAILASLPTGVVVRDAGGRAVRANPAARAIVGLPETAGAGEVEARARELDAGGGPGAWREREIAGEGARRVLATRTSPVAGGGSVQLLDDRTELADLSARLHQLDKLAALGHMAGGIAHELRNPMHAAGGFASLLLGRLGAGSKEHQWAGLIARGIAECEGILASMLALAAPREPRLERIDPSALLADAVRLVEEAGPGRAGAPIRIEVETDAPAFAGDRVQLRQAIRNLLANACEVQPHGGRVRVRAALASGELVVSVADAGPGIPAALRARVLEPFFTTRAEGSGLGLALADAIARRHGGRLEIAAHPSDLGGALVALAVPHRPVP